MSSENNPSIWTFDNYVTNIGNVGYVVGEASDVISEEQMLHSASVAFANENGGPLTRLCIKKITESSMFAEDAVNSALLGLVPVIDTKSVLLQAGQYPCIPGWHCDGVERDLVTGQPDMTTLGTNAAHYTIVLNDADDTNSGTLFMAEKLSMPTCDPRENIGVWKYVDSHITNVLCMATTEPPKMVRAESGGVYRFRRSSLHNCPPAGQRQWRFFFRLSFCHRMPINKIRRQVNVYTDINKGW